MTFWIYIDVKFNGNSAAFWIRSPKIERQKLGDIVEAWFSFERLLIAN